MARQGRSLTIVGVLVAAFLGGAGCHLLFDGAAARAADQGRTVRAEAFVLVDAEGKEWARLGMPAKDMAALTVLDKKGKARLRVGALEEPAGYGMSAYDAEGRMRTTIAHWADDIAGMRMFDAQGTKRIGLGLADFGCGLSLANATGAQRIGAGVGVGGGGGDFTMHDYEGKVIWRSSQHIVREE